MGTCPICGASIPENLVKSIQDPSQPEKCPKRGRGEPKLKNVSPEIDYDPIDPETELSMWRYMQSMNLFSPLTQNDFVLAHG